MIKMPNDVEFIIDVLHEKGFEAYIVGGCVRDSILLKSPKDWDITTNATPDDVKNTFNEFNVIDTGLKHGTVTLMLDNIGYEITTYRVDGNYSDGRKPDSVRFTLSLQEDLSRRDFTINSMAFNYKTGLIDYFGGIEDLKNKVIKCVGNPIDRFKEDALRMLRAIRFSAQLNFEIEYNTYTAIIILKDNIKSISKERIKDELCKILLSNNFDALYALYETLLFYISKDLYNCGSCSQYNPYHIYDVLSHSFGATIKIENEIHLKLTMLLHDIGKPKTKTKDIFGIDHFYGHPELSSEMAVKILRDLRFDNYTVMKVRDLILYHDAEIIDNKKSVRKWLNKIGVQMLLDLLKVKESDIFAQNLDYYEERHEKICNIKKIIDEVIEEQNCFSLKDLAINGNDLIKIGYKSGKLIGETLNNCLEIVLENPENNNKEHLLNFAKRILIIDKYFENFNINDILISERNGV
jgi:tRNA nucleotidyltransferase (CCA-adding enzyme)